MGRFQRLRRLDHLLQSLSDIHRSHRKIDEERRHLIVLTGLPRAAPCRFGHHRSEYPSLGWFASMLEEARERVGHRGEDDVIDRPAERALHCARIVKGDIGHREPPRRADGGVERATGGKPACQCARSTKRDHGGVRGGRARMQDRPGGSARERDRRLDRAVEERVDEQSHRGRLDRRVPVFDLHRCRSPGTAPSGGTAEPDGVAKR